MRTIIKYMALVALAALVSCGFSASKGAAPAADSTETVTVSPGMVVTVEDTTAYGSK